MNEPCFPAADLLPQRPPMRLLDEYIDLAPPEAGGRARFAREGIFTGPGGAVSPAGLVEVLAQTAAASASLEARRAAPDGPASAPGYLVGLRDFVFHPKGACAGDLISLRLRETHRLGPARLYDAAARCDELEIVRGTIKVWQHEDAPVAADVPNGPPSPPGPASNPPHPETDVGRILSDLLRLASLENETTQARISLDPTLPPFRGHFPGNPILPGVCLLEVARLVANAHAPDAPRLGLIDNARFSRLACPGETLVAQAVDKPGGDAGPGRRIRIDIRSEIEDGENPKVADITLGMLPS